jgi:hypothetical protein
VHAYALSLQLFFRFLLNCKRLDCPTSIITPPIAAVCSCTRLHPLGVTHCHSLSLTVTHWKKGASG